MSGTIVTNLPDDDEPLPRRKPAIDEVHAAHAAAGEFLPPLSPTSHLDNNTPTPMGTPMGTPMASGIGGPLPGTVGTTPITGMSPQSTTIVDTSGAAGMGSMMMNQQTMQMNNMAATAQAQASVGLAQTQLDQTLLNDQLKKEDEHWVKSYWRPAMGWLYMLICFMDFVGFPMLTMFLPVIERGFGVTIGYTPWQSLTLSNGGLIHLAFGGILGVAAFTRGQEKLAGMK